MGHFVRDAGFGIWPVLFFGIFGLVVALRHATSPSRERMTLVVGLAIATVLSGMLGTVTGVQASAAAYVDSDVTVRLFLVGLRESLNNMFAALIFATAQTLVATYGAHKLARAIKTGEPVAD